MGPKGMPLQTRRRFLQHTAATSLLAFAGCGRHSNSDELLHVSYDATRELYRHLNRVFVEHRNKEESHAVRVKMSHGGSGAQTRAVLDGLQAHVVSLALWLDVQALVQKGLVDSDWEQRYPNRSLPYVSTVVFVVREGNPYEIQDWPDLLRSNLQIITANPKTSGGARLNVLAAWLSVTARGGSEREAYDFLRHLFQRIPVLDSGARGAALTFARKGIGDVLLTWENEAYLQQRELRGRVTIVHPPLSIQAEPPVAAVDANVRHFGYETLVNDYIRFLYTPVAQEIIAEHYLRPVLWQKDTRFVPLRLLRPCDEEHRLGNWPEIQRRFFAEGGLIDQIYRHMR